DSSSSSGRSGGCRLTLRDRRMANTAAASVEDTIEPSSRPVVVDTSSTRAATRPVTTAVTSTPAVASRSPGASTGRTARQSVSNPPPKRMKARATTPTPWASSTSSNSMPPGPSDPASMPMARNRSSDGTPRRSDTLLASTPSRRSPAATAITGPGSVIAGPPGGARPPSRRLRPRRRRAPRHHRPAGGQHRVAAGAPAAGACRQLLLGAVDPHGAAGPTDVGHHHDVAPLHDHGARPVVAPRLDRALAGVPQGGLAPAQREQLPVPGEDVAVGRVVPLLPPQHRRLPARRVLRVDHLVRRPPEAGQVALPAPPHRRGDVGVGVVGEVEERRGGRPLLALEDQRHVRRGEHQRAGPVEG